MLWRRILIIQTLVSQENLKDFSRHYFSRKKYLIRNCCTVIKLSLLRHLNILDRLQSIRMSEISYSINVNENCCSVSEFRGRIFKAYQLTCGVQFNQWKVLPKRL